VRWVVSASNAGNAPLLCGLGDHFPRGRFAS
jgi:hypothetical protein